MEVDPAALLSTLVEASAAGTAMAEITVVEKGLAVTRVIVMAHGADAASLKEWAIRSAALVQTPIGKPGN